MSDSVKTKLKRLIFWLRKLSVHFIAYFWKLPTWSVVVGATVLVIGVILITDENSQVSKILNNVQTPYLNLKGT
ncbi:MAG: hypothetical protein RIE73_11885 [Coleofasciculus sp. C1-SOL-03]|uniref:hypothetical protein n=1 Tax=Coleofasciculus sp. C1-SOL-03 TaxID=3069522 RepID=UPI0032FB4AB4